MAIPYFVRQPMNRNTLLTVIGLFGALMLFFLALSTWIFYDQKRSPDQEITNDFNKLTATDFVKGKIVNGKIDLAIDAFAETYNTRLGLRTSRKSLSTYYLIPIYSTDSAGYINVSYFAVFLAESQYDETMAKIVSQTWSEVTEPVALEIARAEIQTLPAEFRQYLDEYVNDDTIYEEGSFIQWCAANMILGTSDLAVIRSKILPLMIVEKASSEVDINTLIVFGVLFLLLLIAFLFLLLYKKPIRGLEQAPDDGFIKPESFRKF